MGEFDRWMTLERIALSDFMAHILQAYWDGEWSAEEVNRLSEAALDIFTNGRCYLLASACAHETGWAILGFFRRTGDERLVHAVTHDPRTGYAVDILGTRTTDQVRQEMVGAVGLVRMKVLTPFVFEAKEAELLSTIVRGLPWIPFDARPSRTQWREAVERYLVDAD